MQYLLTKLYKKIDHDTIIMEITRLVNEELRRLRNIGKMDRETASYVCDVVISTYLNNVCNDINIYSRIVSQKLHPIFKLYHLYRFVFGFIPRYPVKLNCNRFISTTCFDHLPSSDCQDFVIPEIENLLIVYKNGQVKAYDWFHQKECECEGKIIMDIDTISAPTFKSMAETLWFNECRNRELNELLYRSQAPLRYIITEKKEENSGSSSSEDNSGSETDENESGKRKKITGRPKERHDKYAHAKRMRELQIKKEVQQYDRKLKEMIRAEEMRDRHNSVKEENKAFNVCDRLLLRVGEHQRCIQSQISKMFDDNETENDKFGFTREIKSAVEEKKIELDRIKKILSGYGIQFNEDGSDYRERERIETIVDGIISKSIERFMKEFNMIADQAKHLYDKTHSKIAQLTDMSAPELIGNTENEHVNDILYSEAEKVYDVRSQLNETMGDLRNEVRTNAEMKTFG